MAQVGSLGGAWWSAPVCYGTTMCNYALILSSFPGVQWWKGCQVVLIPPLSSEPQVDPPKYLHCQGKTQGERKMVVLVFAVQLQPTVRWSCRWWCVCKGVLSRGHTIINGVVWAIFLAEQKGYAVWREDWWGHLKSPSPVGGVVSGWE